MSDPRVRSGNVVQTGSGLLRMGGNGTVIIIKFCQSIDLISSHQITVCHRGLALTCPWRL
jgi:hypothetical protein